MQNIQVAITFLNGDRHTVTVGTDKDRPADPVYVRNGVLHIYHNPSRFRLYPLVQVRDILVEVIKDA